MDELPAHPWEIQEALDEGVIINCSWGPKEVLHDDGHVTGMRLQSCLSVFDAQGRFSPQFAEEYTDLTADVIVSPSARPPSSPTLSQAATCFSPSAGCFRSTGRS